MARDQTARERTIEKSDSTDSQASGDDESPSNHLDRREYVKLAGASVAALGGLGLGSSAAAAVDEGGPSNPDDWELAFEDTFEGGSLDTDKWSVGFGWGRDTSASYEEIVDRNVSVEDGMLKVTATHDGGPDSVYAGCVNTKNKHYFGPGTYWEAKLRTPDRHGFLPAFWSKPNSEVWPPEIDFFELLGNDPTESHHNVHYDTSGGEGANHDSLRLSDDGVESTTDFHVYGCAWFEDRVEMYVDGEHVGTHDDPTAMESLRTGAPFYMMLNIHVGKTGEPDFSESWGETMDVEWVRVWEQSSGGGSSGDGSSGDDSSDGSSDGGSGDLPNTVSISGGSSSNSASYTFSVTDTIRKSEAGNASISAEDTITDGTVEGFVGGGTDSYAYAGSITEFSVDGNATVYRNGEQVDPASFGSDTTTSDGSADGGSADDGASHPHLVVVDGSETPNRATTYSFDVNGGVAKDGDHGSINEFDDVSDGRVTGRIIGGKDAYRFSGDITRFQIDGGARVTVEEDFESSN